MRRSGGFSFALLALGAVLTPAGSARADDFNPFTWFSPRNGAPINQSETKPSEQIVRLPARPEDLECPEVDIFDGGATARVGGQSSSEVRYQFAIGDVARECDPQGKQFALKVGVSGRLLIGPAGSPGAYQTALRVEVKQAADGKVLFSKSFPVAVNTNGADQAPFRVLTDPILLPLTRARLDDDYQITVGLGASSGGGHVTKRRRHR